MLLCAVTEEYHALMGEIGEFLGKVYEKTVIVPASPTLLVSKEEDNREDMFASVDSFFELEESCLEQDEENEIDRLEKRTLSFLARIAKEELSGFHLPEELAGKDHNDIINMLIVEEQKYLPSQSKIWGDSMIQIRELLLSLQQRHSFRLVQRLSFLLQNSHKKFLYRTNPPFPFVCRTGFKAPEKRPLFCDHEGFCQSISVRG